MGTFKSRLFARFASVEGTPDAVQCTGNALVDADLDREAIKQRIARKGQRDFRRFRAIMRFRWGERSFSVYRLAKRALGNAFGRLNSRRSGCWRRRFLK